MYKELIRLTELGFVVKIKDNGFGSLYLKLTKNNYSSYQLVDKEKMNSFLGDKDAVLVEVFKELERNHVDKNG